MAGSESANAAVDNRPLVFGRYLSADVWSEPGIGVLWIDGDKTLARQALAAFTASLAAEAGIEQAPQVAVSGWDTGVPAEAEMVCFYGRDFVEVVVQAAQWNRFQLSPELLLYLHVQRLAAAVVQQSDVVAFAAPKSASWLQVFSACLELAKSGEDGLGHWGSQVGTYVASFAPAWSDQKLQALRQLCVSAAIRLGASGTPGREDADGCSQLVDAWLWLCVDVFMRQVWDRHAEPESETEQPSSYRIMYRGEEETMTHWQEALAGPERTFPADGWLVWRTLRQVFQTSGWHADTLFDRSGSTYYHLEFELVPPAVDGVLPDWQVIYYVAHNEWDAKAPLRDWWRRPERVWNVGKDVLEGPDVWILPKLLEAAAVSDAILKSLQTPAVSSCMLSPDEVFEFLTKQMPALEELGFPVRYPDFGAAAASDVRIRVQVKRVRGKSVPTGRSPAPTWFDSEQLVDFDWTVAIGDEVISREAFEKMVEQRTPFVQLDGSWRLVPVQAVLEQLEELRSSGTGRTRVNLMQFVRTVLLSQEQDDETIPLELSFDEDAFDARQVIRTLEQAYLPPDVAPPAGFTGSLRDYQRRGYAWLLHLREIGCGGVLADDMGLGKTIQVLAYLQQLKESGRARGVHLLICPTSLLQNWRAELLRFTPDLCVHMHHGASRNDLLESGLTVFEKALAAGCDLVITTYATVVRDIELFQRQPWDVVVVDEAQNIKNPETKQASAVRSLPALHRIALTGTPIENRLEELWSIFQFTNPGYLGGMQWFRRVFVEPIAATRDGQATRRLHQLLRPVLLRRSKSDPAIQIELPDKWEVVEYAGLTQEQAALYQSVVNRLFTGIRGVPGMSRRGQILTALVRLKQVCDHPCLAEGGTSSVTRSGKLKMLLDLLEPVVEEGEAGIVFTQFRDMGDLLCDALEERFGWRPRFLHGGLSATERGTIVERFQSAQDPSRVLVLSLKAGGVGLNLTRANHVFHYDRWWNPAVEDQATDRVFRIGQVRDVQVHKLVCPGTLEERIDALIESKRQLSSLVVGESEGWITELDNDALHALFALDTNAAVEDDGEW